MRGQISLEAILVVGLVVIIVASLMSLMAERYSLAIELGESGEAKMLGEFLAEAINSVYANGEGFKIILTGNQLNLEHLSEIDANFKICNSNSTIYVVKNAEKVGGGLKIAEIPIIPDNIVIITSNASEITIYNNGTNILISANANITLGCM